MSAQPGPLPSDLPEPIRTSLRGHSSLQHGPGPGGFTAVTMIGVREAARRMDSSLREAMICLLERDIWPLRFARNRGVFQARQQARLLRCRAAVIGLGGLGGHVATLLARSGVGAFTLCDGDVFDESNLNRQLLCREDSLGQNKAAAAKAELERIASHLCLRVVTERATPENMADVLSGAHVALDCLDSLAARRDLEDAAHAANLPFIHGAIAGYEGFTTVSLPGDRLMQALYGDSGDERSGAEVLAGVPAVTAAALAAVQAALAVRTLLDDPMADTLAHLDLSVPILELFAREHE